MPSIILSYDRMLLKETTVQTHCGTEFPVATFRNSQSKQQIWSNEVQRMIYYSKRFTELCEWLSPVVVLVGKCESEELMQMCFVSFQSFHHVLSNVSSAAQFMQPGWTYFHQVASKTFRLKGFQPELAACSRKLERDVHNQHKQYCQTLSPCKKNFYVNF